MARKADKPKSKAEVKAVADRAEKRSNAKKELPKTASGKVAAQPADPTDYVSAAVNKGYKLPSQNDLRNLLKQCQGYKDDMDETNGMLRKKIAYAVDKKNLAKKPFAELRKLNRMEAEALADYWDTLLAYMDMAGLMERMASVTRLPLPEPAEKAEAAEPEPEKAAEPAADPAPPAPETNVVQPMFGRLAPQSQSAKADAIAAAAGTNR